MASNQLLTKGSIILTIFRTALLFIIYFVNYGVGFAEEKLRPDISVLADPSMTVAITLIARQYASLYHTPVSVEFASTHDQIQAIVDGTAADVLVAAKASWVQQMQAKGLIDVYSRTNVARNRLVLATSPSTVGPPVLKRGLRLKDFMSPSQDRQIALGDPEYTAEGTYTMQALRKLRLSDELEPSFAFFKDSRRLADAVGHDQGYGFLFETDAVLFPQVKIANVVSTDNYLPIIYQAVVVVGENMKGGRSFSDFLTSDTARSILAQRGFDVNL